jgi:uncharacterized protein (UPF0332 family)
MIKKSSRALDAARILFEHNNFEAASSKAYYAVFHILQAVLLTKSLSFSKHSGVISAFSKYFIKEGIFSEDFGRIIKDLRKNREIGDYDYFHYISSEQAKTDFKNAEDIIKAIKKYLSDFFKDIE